MPEINDDLFSNVPNDTLEIYLMMINLLGLIETD